MRSMTGFVRETFNEDSYGTVMIEIKSLNGKNLSPVFRIPEEMNSLEMKMRKLLRDHYERGTVFISIKTDYSAGFMKNLLSEKLKKINIIAEDFPDNSYLPLILPSFMQDMQNINTLNSSTEQSILEHFNSALDKIDIMRNREGTLIEDDLINYCSEIEDILEPVDKVKDSIVEEKKLKLREMIEDNDQLIMDNILLYADKIDISEELSRLRFHIEKVKNASSGSTVYFVLQEMHREINTMGSKSDSMEIKEAVIGVKEIIEKMKEQVMNIE
ncbi:MAG: DUF1732 domain-containing protein [candidate division WOR-3 bacterium]|nr:DUF1732 domain-containing protein [candidate division WOR-3 bacterium]